MIPAQRKPFIDGSIPRLLRISSEKDWLSLEGIVERGHFHACKWFVSNKLQTGFVTPVFLPLYALCRSAFERCLRGLPPLWIFTRCASPRHSRLHHSPVSPPRVKRTAPRSRPHPSQQSRAKMPREVMRSESCDGFTRIDHRFRYTRIGAVAALSVMRPSVSGRVLSGAALPIPITSAPLAFIRLS